MSPALALASEAACYKKYEGEGEGELVQESEYHKGVRHLCEKGVTKVPPKYILPVLDRPNHNHTEKDQDANNNVKLPVIDLAQLLSSTSRSHALESLSKACQEYGFFQLINHGIGEEVIENMIEVGREFFQLPFEERSKYMSKDIRSPVRYGTSYNQNNDGVFCWRDFLKLFCHPLQDVLPHWPSSPSKLRQATVKYSEETKRLYVMLVEAILESLGLVENKGSKKNCEQYLEEFEDGSQVIVMNCYPKCPEPDLTLGMLPHSDYGFLTLLLQDDVKSLQIQHQGRWLYVEPIPNSFVVNVGDHLEIFSNGRCKSVVHRVLANPTKSRISIASLHSLPLDRVMRPAPELVNEANPRSYKDTDFATFLDYMASSSYSPNKSFLDSRRLN